MQAELSHDSDEWEDVLVLSYVPVMRDLDELPKGRKLIKLLDSVCFEQKLLPIQKYNSNSLFWPSPGNLLRITCHSGDNKHTSTLQKVNGEYLNVLEDQLQALVSKYPISHLHVSHGGKFLIVVENSLQASNIVIARVDLADNTLHKLVDVPPDQVILSEVSTDTFRMLINNTCYVSNKYAYFAAKDIVFRINVWTGVVELVFKVEALAELNQPSEILYDCKFTRFSEKLLVITTSPLYGGHQAKNIRIIQESDCKVVHFLKSKNIERGNSYYGSRFAVLKEGLITKSNSGGYVAKSKRYKNSYTLHSLKDLKVITKHVVDNTCQYSRDWFSINYFRIWGFPVFIESVFIDKKNSYHFSLSILYKNRFHQLTTPCPIDMRYKKIESLTVVTQPDPKLTELVVEVTGLNNRGIRQLHLLRLKI